MNLQNNFPSTLIAHSDIYSVQEFNTHTHTHTPDSFSPGCFNLPEMF